MRQQQTRGMKVHSAIKKRCEHCKVSGGTAADERLVSGQVADWLLGI